MDSLLVRWESSKVFATQYGLECWDDAQGGYRLLVEEILPNETALPELRGTEWVTHFMTAEYCDACAAEVERDWAESERRRGQEPTSEAPDDDDLPF